MSYIIMFFSLISIKIVGIELFGVLQTAFFTLTGNEIVHTYLQPLLSWKVVNGYSFSVPSNNIQLPQQIINMDYNAEFISNLNLFLIFPK